MTEQPDDLKEELEKLRQENEALKRRLEKHELLSPIPDAPVHEPLQLSILPQEADASTKTTRPIDNHSTVQEKISLFRSLFRGRDDVYAERWDNDYLGRNGYSPSADKKWNAQHPKEKKRYFPLTDQVIEAHLSGKKTIGAYPLLHNSKTWLLACDFDGQGWKLDALAYLEICKKYGVPAYLERSRSGDGGHVWIFFANAVKAEQARQLGMRLLRQTLEARAELDLASYDRFFPSQDFTPRGGFGNLIALPLQKQCRTKGNSEFVDPKSPDLESWPDQWKFLGEIKRISQSELTGIMVKVPLISVGTGSFIISPQQIREKAPPPATIRTALGALFSIEKAGIPPWLLSQIKHTASLWNPEFFTRQRKRYSTYGVPPLLRCYEEDMSHIYVPRGTKEEIESMLKAAGSDVVAEDLRPTFDPLKLHFVGELSDTQKQAIQTTLEHDIGILVAPPGAGKTVMGCCAIAERNVPTLVLAHRQPILDQWRHQLIRFLGLASSQIGQMGGGRDCQTRMVDLGMLQTLEGFKPDELLAFFSGYGHVIIDECHHIPAATFEASMKRVPSRYILGLTATPQRSDGMDEILLMQCGAIRYRMAMEDSGIPRELLVRETQVPKTPEEMPIQEVFKVLVRDEERNQLIQEDIVEALLKGRKCIVLSQRKEHCQLLHDALKAKGETPFLLSGALGKKERKAMLTQIKELSPGEDLLIISTGQYLGEGFDCPQVDTLFLTFPISYKSRVIQFVGRILRQHPGKEKVVVYDYYDKRIGVLANMFSKRMIGYRSLKFDVPKGRF